MSKIALSGNASGTGTFTIASPNSNSNYQLDLPAESGTIITTASTTGISASALTTGTIPRARMFAGATLKVQQFTNAGTSTSSTTPVSVQTARFSYTPVSTNSTLYLLHASYLTAGNGGGYAAGGCLVYYYIAEFNGSADVAISNANYLGSSAYSSTYGQVVVAPGFAQIAIANSSTSTRLFNTTGACIYASYPLNIQNIVLTVIEVAN